jgi:hypothetical protein
MSSDDRGGETTRFYFGSSILKDIKGKWERLLFHHSFFLISANPAKMSKRYVVISNEAVASLGGVQFSRRQWVGS